jgi:HEPN domain-containing protein
VPPRNQLAELGADWLAFAESDLEAARACAERSAVQGWTIAFHMQQAVEKSFKGALLLANQVVPRSHDLVKLEEMLGGAGCEVPIGADVLNALTRFAIDDKYPRLRTVTIDRSDAIGLIGAAEKAVAWLRAMLVKVPETTP